MKKISKAIITVDLGFGDSGKGTMVDYLCRRHSANWVVRYNGGAQAGHNVVFDNWTHTFSQFGSGTFAGARTFLSEYVKWNPIALVYEAIALAEKMGVSAKELLDLHFVDIDAPIITPFHVAANRIKETVRGRQKHGSCGKGIGELASDLVNCPDQVLRVRDFVESQRSVLTKLKTIQYRKLQELTQGRVQVTVEAFKDNAELLLNKEEPERIRKAYLEIFAKLNFVKKGFLEDILNKEEYVIFEGSQGVLLDEWHGFHPFTTWDTIIPIRAFHLLEEAKYAGTREVLGIIRSFMTRHGAGPLPTETKTPDIELTHEFNQENEWQNNFRVGYFDFVLLQYAIECLRHYCQLDKLAITHLDVLSRQFMPYTTSYRMGPKNTCDRIIPKFDHDLAHQEGITKVLFKAKPEYERSFMDSNELITEVHHRTGVKVAYGSYGPRASHKKEL